MVNTILRLEGLLLTGAGLAHLVYASLLLDWSAYPFVMCLGAVSFGVLYTLFGLAMVLGSTRLLIPTFVINTLGFVAVLVAGKASPLHTIDPYLMVVDLISLPTLVWLIWTSWKTHKT